MKNLRTLLLVGCLVSVGVFWTMPKVLADDWDQKTVLTFEKPVQLPGVVLPAGTYIFKLVAFSMNRDVVQVRSQDERKLYATIGAIPGYRDNITSENLIVFEERSAGAPRLIKEWFYQGLKNGHEFVYSKEDLSEFDKAEPLGSNKPAGDDIATEHHEQMMQPEESDYLRLLSQKNRDNQIRENR